MNKEKVLIVVNSDCQNPTNLAIKADLLSQATEKDIYILCVVARYPPRILPNPFTARFLRQARITGESSVTPVRTPIEHSS